MTRPWANLTLPAQVAAAILLAGAILSLAVNLPGHLSFDSVIQLAEGRTGLYGNWHPPVMSWLLGIADAIVPGAGLFVVFDTALLCGSMVTLLWLGPRAGWAAVAVAGFCVLTPQFLLYPGIVWKDVLFANALTAGFVALAVAARFWTNARLRFGALAAAGVFLVLAVLTRQNGMAVAPVAAIALGWIAAANMPGRRMVAALAYGGGSLAAVVLVVAAAIWALDLRVDSETSPATQFRLLQTYDLAGALARDPKLDLGQIDDDDPLLARLMRTDAARLYTPERNDTLVNSARLQTALQNVDDATIPAQWRDFVRADPGLYLKIRWDAFRWLLFSPDGLACRPVYAGVSGPAQQMQILGLAPRKDARDVALTAYADIFVGTPVLSHAAYAVVALALLILFLRRRAPADIAMAFLLLAAFAFTASFFVISIACDYRYLYALDIATMAAGFYAATTSPRPLRAGSGVG
jgi:hypothetical protein